MEAADELLTIAELAIGLAGFSGVVAAFTHRGAALNEVDRYHFIILFSVTLSAVFVAFVPFGFHHAGFVGAPLWAWSSGVMLAAAVATSILLAVAAPGNFQSQWIPGFLGSWFVSYGLPLAIVSAQLVNVIGWPAESGPLLFVFGLLVWLLVGGMNFLRLILHRPSQS